MPARHGRNVAALEVHMPPPGQMTWLSICQRFLVGGWATPLRNMKRSVGMKWNSLLNGKIDTVPNHQPDFDGTLKWFHSWPIPVSSWDSLRLLPSRTSVPVPSENPGLQLPGNTNNTVPSPVDHGGRLPELLRFNAYEKSSWKQRKYVNCFIMVYHRQQCV